MEKNLVKVYDNKKYHFVISFNHSCFLTQKIDGNAQK